MVKADELAGLLGISDEAPEAYLAIPGNAELEKNTVTASEQVAAFEDASTEPVMSEFSAHHLPLFLTALHSFPESSPASSASLSILSRLTAQPLFVRFLREDPRAKDLLVRLVEKLATYPKDLLETDLVKGSALISTHLSLLTTLLLTSLSLSPKNLTTHLPQHLRALTIASLNQHHLVLTRVARAATKAHDEAERERCRGVMAEIDKMKLVLNWEGDLGEVGSGVRERAEREGKEGRGVWRRCEAKEGVEGVGECDWTRAEMVPCGKCASVRYCSTEHRRAHIKPHKKNCFKPTW